MSFTPNFKGKKELNFLLERRKRRLMMQVCVVSEWIRILDEKLLLTSLEHTHMWLAPSFGSCLHPIVKNSMCAVQWASSSSSSFCCAWKKERCASKSLNIIFFPRSLCNFLSEWFLRNFSKFCAKNEQNRENETRHGAPIMGNWWCLEGWSWTNHLNSLFLSFLQS